MKKRKTIAQQLREEFIQTTETLWGTEVKANLYVSGILVITAILIFCIFILSLFHVFSIDSDFLAPYLGLAIMGLAVPACICLYYKGEKNWLKVLLLSCYVLVLAMLHSVLGHNIVLCLAFPVVLSVRYYSKPLTTLVAGLTIITYLIASYFGITHQITRLDLNMVELPAGTVLNFPEFMPLRDAVDPSLIDTHHLFLHFLQHSFLPKLIIFIMISMICARVAERGRAAIYAQKAETEKTQQIAVELNLASAIQSNVLPNTFPVFPERKEISLYASMTPAKQVGGDFYDFFFTDEDHLVLVMADVSGKGIPAALFMMVARTLIKNRALMGGTPSEILFDVNNQLCEGNVVKLFVTVWLGIIDLSTGKGVAANAGHEHPVIRSEGDDYKLVIYQHSPVVAAIEDMKFKDHEFELKKGDTFFIYTDGVSEAADINNNLFGTDRLLEALNKEPEATPDKILDNVKDSIDAFVQGAEQFDDITMMALKYYGHQE